MRVPTRRPPVCGTARSGRMNRATRSCMGQCTVGSVVGQRPGGDGAFGGSLRAGAWYRGSRLARHQRSGDVPGETPAERSVTVRAMWKIPTIVGVLVSLVLVAGCSEKAPAEQASPETTPDTETATSADAAAAAGDPTQPCTLLPGKTVGEQLHIRKVAAEPTAERAAGNGAKVYMCQYTASAAGTPVGVLSVSVYEGNQITAPAMIDAVKGNYSAPRDVPGVGEAAATFEDQDKRYLAAAKVSSGTPVMVMYIGAKTTTPEILTALVQPAIEQL